MRITAGSLSLLYMCAFINPSAVLAQTAEPEERTQEQQAQAVSTESEEDYTAYIRPLDKLRTELSQQKALLGTVVDITTRIDQLRNQGAGADILVLLDEDLSQTERIRAVLSNTGHARSDELESIRADIEFLKQMYIQSLQVLQVQQSSATVTTDAPAPWALASSIQYVQTRDRFVPGLVAITTTTGAPLVLKAGESTTIAGKTIALDSVKPASGGRIGIHFVIDGKLETVYYPQ